MRAGTAAKINLPAGITAMSTTARGDFVAGTNAGVVFQVRLVPGVLGVQLGVGCTFLKLWVRTWNVQVEIYLASSWCWVCDKMALRTADHKLQASVGTGLWLLWMV